MYNPNDIVINPNDAGTPANQPQPQPSGTNPADQGSTSVPTPPTAPTAPVAPAVPTPESDDGFDIDQALETVEVPTPTPEPAIKPNPRHETPTPPPVAPAAPVSTPLPKKSTPVAPVTPTVPPVSPTPDSPAKQAVHQAFGVAGAASSAVAGAGAVAPQSPSAPTKPRVVRTKKKGRRISVVGYAIGCGLFLLLLLGGGAAVLWAMFQDPNQTWQWIDRSAGEQLLKIFAGTIFGILTLFGAFFFFVNMFRLASKKNTKKISYIFGLIVGLILMGIGLGAGIVAMNRLNSLSNQTYSSGYLVTPYVVLGQGEGLRSLVDPTPPLLIAPTEIIYALDVNIYNTLKGQRGLQQDPAMVLDCGNGQTFPLNTANNNASFGPCFYTDKGRYDVAVIITYTDRSTGQQTEEVIPISNLPIASSIQLSNTDGTSTEDLSLNTKQTELIAGVAPAKINFDAQNLITDLQLPTNNIVWDIDGDGTFERTEDVIFSENFIQSKLHTIAYQLPGVSPYTYGFDLRVQQSDVPICTVSVASTTSMSYDFVISFVETNVGISQYGFEVINTATNQLVDRQSSALGSLSYDFTREGSYAVKAYFITDDGNRGSCQSDNFRVGAVPYVIDYETRIQGPNESSAQVLARSDILTIEEDKSRTITQIPNKLDITINDVRPRSNTVVPIVMLDGEPKLSSDNRRFQVVIDTVGEHTISIGARDELTNETSIIHTHTVNVQLPAVEGMLQVRPDNVGNEPFQVTLDASTVTLNDAEDEVVYFSRDFGDGETKKNQNQGVIQHTYYFDKETQEGIYRPTATITTRKGRTLTLQLEDPITVKRALRNAEIIFDSHPAQLAGVGETVQMELVVDGIPQTVVRDFGDGENFQCDGRTCNEVTHNFLQAGTYTVQVTVTYDDHPDIVSKAKLIVQ